MFVFSNVIGSILIGVYVAMSLENQLSSKANLFIVTGFLGGLTTFSSFTLEIFDMFSNRQKEKTWYYWIGSVLVCISCVFLGIYLHHII